MHTNWTIRARELAATMTLCATALVGCGGGETCDPNAAPRFGCPSLECSTVAEGETVTETYENTAEPFFETYCIRCHSQNATEPASVRPLDSQRLFWDEPERIRANLSDIRDQVGVFNTMPAEPPDPTCGERMAVVRWIDGGAVGL